MFGARTAGAQPLLEPATAPALAYALRSATTELLATIPLAEQAFFAFSLDDGLRSD